MQGTTFPLAGMGTPVGIVSPVELTSTKEEVSTPGVKVLRDSIFTGMTVRVSGILCTFWWVGTTSGLPAGTTFGFATLPGSMTLPLAGTGTPVFSVSPSELMIGFILSPVRGLILYPSETFNTTILGAGCIGAISSRVLGLSPLQEAIDKIMVRCVNTLLSIFPRES